MSRGVERVEEEEACGAYLERDGRGWKVSGSKEKVE